MSQSLRPFFQLLHLAGQSRPVLDMRQDLGEPAFNALCVAGWLDILTDDDDVPLALRAATTPSSRRHEELHRRVFDQGPLCVPNELRLLESVYRWLDLRGTVPTRVCIDLELALLGWLEWPIHRPAFFVRRVAHPDNLRQLEEFGKHGGAVIVTTTQEPSLPPFVLARYSDQCPVRLLALENYAEIRGSCAGLRVAPSDVRRQQRVTETTPGYAIITMAGVRPVDDQEVEAVRRASHEYDLFVDFTAPVEGRAGYYAGSGRRGDTHWTFELTHFEGAILRELVSAPNKVFAPESLRCCLDLQIRTPKRKLCDMRKHADVRYGRNSYRAFHGLKNSLGQTDRFSFRPPSGFKLAVLVHLSD